MLVLSREAGQDIRIGPAITIRVVRVRGGKVQLAISAPDDVQILRAELESRVFAAGEEFRSSNVPAVA